MSNIICIMMKRFLSLIVILIATFTSVKAEGELNKEQKNLRADLYDFLREEEFNPDVDENGNLFYKYNNMTYHLEVYSADDNPMCVRVYSVIPYPSGVTKEMMMMASNILNQEKGIKVNSYDNEYVIGTELYVRSAEPIKLSLYKLMEMISVVKSETVNACGNISSISGVGPIIPFLITELSIANCTRDGMYINDYGSFIPANRLTCLRPRITIMPINSFGTFKVEVKLYRENKLLRNRRYSPQRCSYRCDVVVNKGGYQTIELPYANLIAFRIKGSYRFEIWYNGYCLGSASTNVR